MVNLKKLKEIKRDFSKRNIDTSQVGFYDNPTFIRVEQNNPSYLNHYAKYVQLKQYDSSYLALVREKVPFIASLLYKELKKDGRLGACVDMSSTLSRILEKEGIWNHMVFGSLSIDYPKESGLERGHFWCVDYSVGATAAHAWLFVPPYHIVDLTIKMQPYSQGQEKYLPDILLSEEASPYTPVAEDLINTAIIHQLQRSEVKDVIRHAIPQFKAFNNVFPAVSTEENNCVFHYVPTSISAPDTSFEEAVNLKLNGQYGYKIYNDVIKPALKERGY
jgi:hypothetical protein